MILATFVIACVFSATPSQPLLPCLPGQDQAGGTPPPSQSSPPPSDSTPPCPASPQSAQPADCKPASPQQPQKKTKRKSSSAPSAAPKDPSQGPTKTVVRNGSTNEPTVSISTPLTEKQASQRAQTTKQMLAS